MKNITPQVINELLKMVRYQPENAVVNQTLIRAMPKAVYSMINIGHYGLGFPDYTHFTSPIRRYPDLIVHRLLKEYANEKPDNKRLNKLNSILPQIATHTSATERHAMDAERASTKLASAIYAQSMLGEIFGGTVNGVMPYGLFILLDDIYCEGLLHIREINNDHYIYDAKKIRLLGKHSKTTYSLGTRVRVRILKVNIDKRVIDLTLVDKDEF